MSRLEPECLTRTTQLSPIGELRQSNSNEIAMTNHETIEIASMAFRTETMLLSLSGSELTDRAVTCGRRTGGARGGRPGARAEHRDDCIRAQLRPPARPNTDATYRLLAGDADYSQLLGLTTAANFVGLPDQYSSRRS
jgi:hypothetical protein